MGVTITRAPQNPKPYRQPKLETLHKPGAFGRLLWHLLAFRIQGSGLFIFEGSVK